jgi:membrane fusion protein (multidrug efflux system)
MSMARTNDEEIPNETGLTEEQERHVKELIRSVIEPATTDGDTPSGDGKKVSVKKPLYKRPLALIALALVVTVAATYGVRAYSYASVHESTDDAFIDGHPVPIAPQVGGRILRVAVNDNQVVKKGDLLLEIDPSDFNVQLANAEASLNAAIARRKSAAISVDLTQTTSSAGVDQASAAVDSAASGVRNAEAGVVAAQGRLAQAQAQVAAAEAEATRTATQEKRYADLNREGIISHQDYDDTVAAATAAAAQLDAARKAAATAQAAVTQAEAQVATSRAQVGQAKGQLAASNAAPQQVALSASQVDTADAAIQQAQAAVQQAKLSLSYTKVYAPGDGRITNKSVEAGAYVQTGQNLMTLVPDQLWVTANFKETQLAHMRPGQPVEISVDAYPGVVLKGHVDSLQSGSGAAFSLLPPENATGNYVKVVQRIPVKIVFDEAPDGRYLLGPGMSVVPEVEVR